nr:DUF308 domain-containing protein [Bradyrhizobium sp. SRS-191]
MRHAVRQALGSRWRLLLVQGVAMLIHGGLAIAVPVVARMPVDLFIGWLFVVAGVIGLATILATYDVPAFRWILVTAALSIAAGMLLLSRPLESAASLTIVLVALFAAEGVCQIATSIAYRKVIAFSWRWMLASGIVDLAMAAIMIAFWPISAAWVLGSFVGVNLMTSGAAIVTAALAARSFAGLAAPVPAPARLT